MIPLDTSWKQVLNEEINKSYMQDLFNFLKLEKKQKKVIYPKHENIFNSLNLTPLDKVKVVIIGQDPYHGEGQAHGLSFSVPKGIKLPPSLQNIYKELNSDLGIEISKCGLLEHWAKQGVLLLNSVLTVEKNLPASHQNKGWEQFTDKIVSILNGQKRKIVFLLWGSYAQKKCKIVSKNHYILKSVHPSPLSAYRGFFGCRHFSKTNKILEENGLEAIKW